jgi:hypothetical protein
MNQTITTKQQYDDYKNVPKDNSREKVCYLVASQYYSTEEQDDILHPCLVELIDGAVVKAVKLLDEFTDDHQDCFVFQITTDKNDWVISFWWVGASLISDMQQRWVRFGSKLLT